MYVYIYVHINDELDMQYVFLAVRYIDICIHIETIRFQQLWDMKYMLLAVRDPQYFYSSITGSERNPIIKLQYVLYMYVYVFVSIIRPQSNNILFRVDQAKMSPSTLWPVVRFTLQNQGETFFPDFIFTIHTKLSYKLLTIKVTMRG